MFYCFSSDVLFHRVQLNWNISKKTFVPQLIDCVTLAASNLSRFTSQCNKANLLACSRPLMTMNSFLCFAMSGSHNLQCTPDMPLAVKWNKQTLLEKRDNLIESGSCSKKKRCSITTTNIVKLSHWNLLIEYFNNCII
jgi:hypothetical protein